MKIRISKKFYQKPVFWIWFLLVYNCIYRALCGLLGFPSGITYLSDVACMVLGIALIQNKKSILFDAKMTRFLLLFLFAETLMGYALNCYSPLIYIWGCRTFFRYFIFFLACIRFLKKEDIDKILKFFVYMVYANAAMCVLEYGLGFGWDNISGLYTGGRTLRGGSSGLNILMCISCTYLMIQFLSRKISMLQMGIPIFLCMLMAALSEQKAFYFEFIIILALVSLFSRFSVKKLVIISGGALAVFVGLTLYMKYYGNMNNIFSIEAMMAYSGTDGSTYGQHLLNRTTALPYMLENILKSPIQKIFGVGLGYGDNVSLSFISSGFFTKYNYLGYHYFFTSLEVVNIGILGLVLYYAFLLSVFIYTRKKAKKISDTLKNYYIFAGVAVALCVFFTAYNQTPILDIAAFNIYFALAVPFVITHGQLQKGGEQV